MFFSKCYREGLGPCLIKGNVTDFFFENRPYPLEEMWGIWRLVLSLRDNFFSPSPEEVSKILPFRTRHVYQKKRFMKRTTPKLKRTKTFSFKDKTNVQIPQTIFSQIIPPRSSESRYLWQECATPKYYVCVYYIVGGFNPFEKS